MGKAFEVGAFYMANDSRYDPIRILRRTPRYVFVSNGLNTWRMLVRVDDEGNEYMADSSMSKKWRDTMTFSAVKRVTQM